MCRPGWGQFQIDGRSERGGQQSANDAYAQAINTGSKSLALNVIKELAPKDYVLQFHNLNANLDKIFAPPVETFNCPYLSSSFDQVPEEIECWVADGLIRLIYLLTTDQTNKKFIKICRELHEDGSPHLHVLIQFEGKYKCQNNRFFDLVSPTRSAHFHPNIQGAKSSSDVKSYMEKDGDTSEWGTFQIDGRSARGGQQSANDAYAQAINTGSKLLALNVIKELAPKDYVLQFHNLNANLEKICIIQKKAVILQPI